MHSDRHPTKPYRTLAVLACLTLAGTWGAPGASAHEGHDRAAEGVGPAVVTQGFFQSMSEEGETVEGFAKLVVHDGQTQLFVQLEGLDEGKVYPAHLHSGSCLESGPHYLNDPVGGAGPPNELWPSTDPDDPAADLQADSHGEARGEGTAPWAARTEALSVNIHAPAEHGHDQAKEGEEQHDANDGQISAQHSHDGDDGDDAKDGNDGKDGDDGKDAADGDDGNDGEPGSDAEDGEPAAEAGHAHAPAARLACADLT